MIENPAIELWFLPPTAHHPILARVFPDRHAFMRQVRNLQEQVLLLFLVLIRARRQIDNFFTDLTYASFEFIARFSARTFRANLLAQFIAFGVELLQRGFVFAPFVVDLEQLVDLRLVPAAARSQSFLDEIRLFANQTNIEHACNYQPCAPTSNA